MPRPKVYRNRVAALKVIVDAVPEAAEELTYDELYALAQEREIKGRSSMTKDELIAALGG